MNAHRREVARLLRRGELEQAVIAAECAHREDQLIHALKVVEIYVGVLDSKAQQMAGSKDIPPDALGALSSVLYASKKMAELEELRELRKLFQAKYGKDYVAEACTDGPCNRWEVSDALKSYLTHAPLEPEEKLILLAKIAEQYHVTWDVEKARNELMPEPTPQYQQHAERVVAPAAPTIPPPEPRFAPQRALAPPAPAPAPMPSPPMPRPSPPPHPATQKPQPAAAHHAPPPPCIPPPGAPAAAAAAAAPPRQQHQQQQQQPPNFAAAVLGSQILPILRPNAARPPARSAPQSPLGRVSESGAPEPPAGWLAALGPRPVTGSPDNAYRAPGSFSYFSRDDLDLAPAAQAPRAQSDPQLRGRAAAAALFGATPTASMVTPLAGQQVAAAAARRFAPNLAPVASEEGPESPLAAPPARFAQPQPQPRAAAPLHVPVAPLAAAAPRARPQPQPFKAACRSSFDEEMDDVRARFDRLRRH